MSRKAGQEKLKRHDKYLFLLKKPEETHILISPGVMLKVKKLASEVEMPWAKRIKKEVPD